MNALPLGLVTELIVRTVLIAAGTAAVLWILRIRTASVRHAAWTAVVIAMLALPLLLAAQIRMSLPVLEPAPAEATSSQGSSDSGSSLASEASSSGAAEGAASSAPAQTSEEPGPISWGVLFLSAYLAGALGLLLRLIVGTVQANRLRGTAALLDGRLTSDYCVTPITVGWLKPVLILPRGWDQWSSEQLTVVLTHEHEHARRHDPLAQWLALFNRAVFWFHPLAWWLERRLATLAEEACDAAVIAAGHSPQNYSEYLLDMARTVSRQHGRVRLVGMAMPGTGLSERLRLILKGLPTMHVSRARLLCTIAFCVMSSVIFAAGNLAERAQQKNESTIKFEVVSIRPCANLPPDAFGRSGSAGHQTTSPGHVHWNCVPLSRLIIEAYATSEQEMISFLAPRDGDPPKPVRGGPSWVESELYNVEVTLSGDQRNVTGSAGVALVRQAMRPALRAMLEDRFQLKASRLTEQFPIYALTIAPGGPNKDTFRAAVDGDCQPAPVPDASGRRPVPDNRPICGGGGGRGAEARQRIQEAAARGTRFSEFASFTTAMLASRLSRSMDRQVIDRTGLDGKFNFALEYVVNATMIGEIEGNRRMEALMSTARPPQEQKPAAVAPPDGPTIFQAVGMLGLKLSSATGPVEYFQIDSVQRPKPNEAIPAAPLTPSAETSADQSGNTPDGSSTRQSTGAGTQSAKVTTGAVQFDVVSIRPCAGLPPAGGRGLAPGSAQYSPEYVHWDCATLAELIEQAYAGPDTPLLNVLEDPRESSAKRIRGGPSWLESDRFTIEARVSGDTNKPEMRRAEYYTYMGPAVNPALRALLADRFQLKLRRATEQRSMYALIVAADGLNKTRLTPTAPDDCWNWTRGTLRNPPAGFESKPMCGTQGSGGRRGGAGPHVPGIVRTFYTGKTMESFADSLAGTMDRYVIDKTGVDGMFNFMLEYVEDDSTPPYYSPNDPYADRARAAREARKNNPPSGPNIFKALEGLGLKLDRTTGPAEYLQIDSAQRPKPNGPAS